MQTNMIPVDNYSSYFRTCMNDRTGTDQKVSLSNCTRIAGITKTHTNTEIRMDYFLLFSTSVIICGTDRQVYTL